MKCRAGAVLKNENYNLNFGRSARIPEYCYISDGAKDIRVPIAKTSFITKEDYVTSGKSGIYAEMKTCDIEWLYEFVKKSIFKNGQPIVGKKNPQNLDVLVFKSTKLDSSAQIQITRNIHNFIQLDYYESNTSKPVLIIICDISKELPIPCKFIHGNNNNLAATQFGKKLCAIYCAAEKYCCTSDSHFCTITTLPKEALSYWAN